MALRSGLNAQLGYARETTYGTYVAPARFLEFKSESLELDIDRMESEGIRAGPRVQRSDRWVSGARTVDGDVNLEILTTGLGAFFEDFVGPVVTVSPFAGVFEHTFTPGDLALGASVQIGRPDSNAGTVHPFSYLGCKVVSALIAGRVGEIGELSMTLAGQDETTAQSLGVASYPANKVLTFVEGKVEVAAAEIDVRSFELNIDNGLATDRMKLNSQLRKEPLEVSKRLYTGTLDAYFVDLVAYNRFVNGTEAALVLTFEGAIIASTFTELLEITMNIRTDGRTPTVSGIEEIPQEIGYKALGNTAPFSLLYRTSDTTP